MSPLVAVMVTGLGVTVVGLAVQGYQARLLLHDRRLLLFEAPPEVIELIQLRVAMAAILASVHVLVASAAVFHLVTHSPLLPVAADYWAASVRVLVSLLVLLGTLLGLFFRRRIGQRG